MEARRSLFWVFHVAAVAQRLGPVSAAFPSPKHKAELEVEQLGLQPVPILYASAADRGLAHHSAVRPLRFLYKEALPSTVTQHHKKGPDHTGLAQENVQIQNCKYSLY